MVGLGASPITSTGIITSSSNRPTHQVDLKLSDEMLKAPGGDLDDQYMTYLDADVGGFGPVGGMCLRNIGGEAGWGGGAFSGTGKPCRWWQRLGCPFFGETQAQNLAQHMCDQAADFAQAAGQLMNPNYRCGNTSVTVERTSMCTWSSTCEYSCWLG